ncbi:MAG TPA: hypothetical protein VFR88_06355 [Microlunatus sp.]|nr:hypothetical protein [Microlunatus sp.]
MIINNEPITFIVTERGLAPVTQLDPMLPTDRGELESGTVSPALAAAVDAADSELFVTKASVAQCTTWNGAAQRGRLRALSRPPR